jgi:hypothetical protein
MPVQRGARKVCAMKLWTGCPSFVTFLGQARKVRAYQRKFIKTINPKLIIFKYSLNMQQIYKLILLFTVLLLGILPTWAQKVLTVTDAQKANPIAPYVYFLKDATHTLTAEQVARYPLDSFQALNQKEIVQLS